MSALRLFRLLTPRGWVTVVLALIGVVIVGAGLGFRWDPLGLNQRRLEAARAQADHARADAVARRVEQTAEVAQRRRLDAFHERANAVDRITAAAVNQARLSDEADEPLADDTVRVLRAHDDELRRLAPHLDR